jgi:hypothetical protein
MTLCMTLAGTLVSYAQKGMGDRTGVAKQAQKPDIVSMSGELIAVETHPCKKATGRAPLGTHLRIQSAAGEEINLHLGPAAEVEGIVAGLETGQAIRFDGFRTDKMPENAYVAQSLYVGEETSTLRDEATLRPFWARQPGKGKGWKGKRRFNQKMGPCWWE